VGFLAGDATQGELRDCCDMVTGADVKIFGDNARERGVFGVRRARLATACQAQTAPSSRRRRLRYFNDASRQDPGKTWASADPLEKWIKN